MNRTTAMIATIVTVLFCGLPGIGLICFAALGMVGTNLPGFYEQNPTATPEQALLGAGIFACIGLLLMLIPALVGFFSFRLSKKEESANQFDYVPPAS